MGYLGNSMADYKPRMTSQSIGCGGECPLWLWLCRAFFVRWRQLTAISEFFLISFCPKQGLHQNEPFLINDDKPLHGRGSPFLDNSASIWSNLMDRASFCKWLQDRIWWSVDHCSKEYIPSLTSSQTLRININWFETQLALMPKDRILGAPQQNLYWPDPNLYDSCIGFVQKQGASKSIGW